MKKDDIRRSNLQSWIDAKAGGNVARFAASIGKAQSQIADMLRGNKAFGEKVARDIESKAGMPAEWLDAQHGSDGSWTTAAVRGAGGVPLLEWGSIKGWIGGGPSIARRVACPFRCGDKAFALVVRGHSMDDEFREGETVFVDPDRQPVHGSFVIAVLADGTPTLKQMVAEDGRSFLRPLNPNWPSPVIAVNGLAVVGTVIGKLKEY